MSAPTAAQAAALTSASRSWSFRHEVLSSANVVLRSANVQQCSVTYNYLADKAKRTCRVTFDASSPFDQLVERYRPYAQLITSAATYEWCLGTFLLSTNTTSEAAKPGDRATSFEGYDLLQILVEDKVTSRYVVAAGTAYTTAIATVLTGAGFGSSQIAASTATLPVAMEWEVGTSKLTIVNELLRAINYTSLSCDPFGTPTAQPYVDPDAATPVWAYAVDANSVILPGIDTSLDLFDVPNVHVGYVSQPDRPTLLSVVTNSDVGSPLSTTNRGRSIVRVLNDEVKDAVDQATLDALVARFAQETSTLFEEASFTTGLMPFHGDGETFTLDDGTGTGPRKFRELSWDMELRAGGSMKHTMRRTVKL